MKRLTALIRNLFRSAERDALIRKELESCVDILTEQKRKLGFSEAEARRLAYVELGGVEQIRQDVRDGTAGSMLENLLQDSRYGFRTLFKTPAFAGIAILTLAIGIGASTAVFSQVDAVFWKTLPVEKPSELRTLAWTSARHSFSVVSLAGPRLPNVGETMGSISWPAYLAIRDQGTAFSSLACWLDPGETRPVVLGEYGLGRVQFVSGNYFQTLGVPALIGRTIAPDDDHHASPSPVAMLSYTFWQRAFGSDPLVTRRSLTLNGHSFAIVGVLPEGFFGFDPGLTPDVLVPLTMIPVASTAPDPLPSRTLWSPCRVIGRLRRGVSDEQARLEAETIVADSIRSNPPSQPYDPPKFYILDASRGMDNFQRTAAGPVLILMVVVSGIALIACANIAGLLLARGAYRQREIATRLALGAPRGRLIRQLATESLMLSSLGGLLGLALGYGINHVAPGVIGQFAPLGGTKLNSDYLHVITFGQHGLPGLHPVLDLRVIGFSILLIIITGLIFGCLPALRSTRVDLLSAMKVAPSGSSRLAFRFTTGKAMVALQAAVSIILLTGAGLFIRTVTNLHSAALGYQPDGLLYVRIEPRISGIPTVQRTDVFENVLTRMSGRPGIQSVSGSFSPPLGSLGEQTSVCTSRFGAADVTDRSVVKNVIAPAFFQTMGQRMLSGREFDLHDRENAEPVAIVNQSLAQKFFQGENPIGQKIGIDCDGPHSQYTVIGVVNDSKWNPRSDAGPIVYQSFRQAGAYVAAPMTIIVRVGDQPQKLISTIRTVVAEVNPNIPMFGEVTTTDLIDQNTSSETTLTGIVIVFGGIALLLACLGIYGLLTYTVSQKTWEIGLRMALGAQRSAVIRLVILESVIPVAVGLAGGVVAALAISRLVGNILYGISPADPTSFGLAFLLFLIISAAAALLPAYRASTIDPKEALR